MERRRLRWGVWVTLAAVLAAVHHFHEPWRDEAEIWIVARDPGLREFLRYFHYTPHPPLWYLLNVPLARAGLDISSQGWLSIFGTLVVAWLLLFRAPFPLRWVVPFLFSAQLAYQYGIIARGYSVEVPILFALAWHHPRRFARPIAHAALLGGLALTEIWVWPIVIILGCEFAWGIANAQRAAARARAPDALALLMLALVALSLPWLLWPAPDANPMVKDTHWYPEGFLFLLQQAFAPLRPFGYLFGPPNSNPLGGRVLWLHALLLLPGLAALSLTTLSLLRHKLALALLTGSLLLFVYITTFKYPGFFWHAAQLPVLFLFPLWLAAADDAQTLEGRAGRALSQLLTLSFSYSALIGLALMMWDVRGPYSGGTDAGAYVTAHSAAGERVIGVGCHQLEAPLAYLAHRNFWHAGLGRPATYMLYNEFAACQESSSEQMLQRTEAAFSERSGLLLLADRALEAPERWRLRLEHESPGLNESFWIYRYR